MKHSLVLFILFTLIIGHAAAQQPTDRSLADQFKLEQEQRKKAMLLQVMDSAVVLMDNQQYEEANKKFLYVLNNIRSVPSDLTYYFGKNSYFLKQYKQSVDWLNKYIQLKGTSGQYYADAVDCLKKAETGLLVERSKDTEKAQEVFSQKYDIDCGPSGRVTCPVCKGSTVIIRKGAFGDDYRTCGFCDKHGTLTCEEYNKLLRGELKPKS